MQNINFLDTIDINADLGEGTGNDALIMPLISSCNIACGGHFGTKKTINDTVKLSRIYNVKIGAHPSFPDTVNFGRKLIKLSDTDLKSSIDKQLHTFITTCENAGARLHHVKPHGALYNLASVDVSTSKILIASILDTGFKPVVYAPENSVLYKIAKDYLPVKAEAFIDRYYTDDLLLVPRKEVNAVIKKPQKAWEQLHAIYKDRKVVSINGKIRNLFAETFCIHSDHPNAVPMLKFVHSQLTLQDIQLNK